MTQTQTYPYRCKSPECQASGMVEQIIYLPGRQPSLDYPCVRCGTSKYLMRVECIHLLVHDPEGLIQGSSWSPLAGTEANRYSTACGRWRDLCRQGHRPKHMTALPDAATCKECRDVIESTKWLGAAQGGLWVPGATDEVGTLTE